MKFASGIGFGLVMLAAFGAPPAPAAVIQPRAATPPLVIIPAAANCDELERWATDLRGALDNTLDPLEHARLASRLEHVHNAEGSCSP